MRFGKGEKIGPYTVAFPHKQSSYAETYRVRDADGKTRFLKLIYRSRLSADRLDADGNVIEAQIARQFHHHNLCKFKESGEIALDGGNCTWFVTEFVSGETLSRKIERDGLPTVFEVKQIAKAVLSALMFLHSRATPIAHNEISALNVMLNYVGEIGDLKLIDFGHASFIGSPAVAPDLDELNAFYLAPERLTGTSSALTDIYSVGALMYQMLSGRLPWLTDIPGRMSAEERLGCILGARQRKLRLPDSGAFDGDKSLTDCVAQALSFNPADRFQSAREFYDALEGRRRFVPRPPSVPAQNPGVPAANPPQNSGENSGTGTTDFSKYFTLDSPQNPASGGQGGVPANSAANSGGTANFGVPAGVPGYGFGAIAGMDDLKNIVREEVIAPVRDPEKFRRYGLGIPNGMLLYGPPGCGKTFFAKQLAEEVGFNFMCVLPSTLGSKYINQTQKNIAKMFEEAEKNAPTIIFIDEINALAPNRQSDIHEATRNAVNELLAQMDRTGEREIFIIGATNFPDSLDPAILRAGRLDRKYYIGPPDANARRALFEMYLSNRPCAEGISFPQLAGATHGYVAADIRLIVDTAARNALKAQSAVTMQMLMQSVAATRPSNSAEDLAFYERVRRRIEED